MSLAGPLRERAQPVRDVGRPPVRALSFTDPFCSWCWAAEPVQLHLREAYGHLVHVEPVMGGLVELAAPLLEDPAQGAWLRRHLQEVAIRTGQPIDADLLETVAAQDFSTWPACIHVKAAQAVGQAVGRRYLRRLRLAVMTERRNPSDPGEAVRLAADVDGLDRIAFQNHLADGSALQAFFRDRQRCVEHDATGFPTLVLQGPDPDGPEVHVVGHRTFRRVEEALLEVAPGAVPRPLRNPDQVLVDHGPCTTRELAEASGCSEDEVEECLEVAPGVQRTEVAGGVLWSVE